VIYVSRGSSESAELFPSHVISLVILHTTKVRREIFFLSTEREKEPHLLFFPAEKEKRGKEECRDIIGEREKERRRKRERRGLLTIHRVRVRTEKSTSS